MKHSLIMLVFLLAACATTTGPAVDKTKMAEGYYMKGLSYLQEKNYELASVEFNRSIQTDSNYKQSYYLLGIISDYRGQLDAAIDYYKEALSIDSEYSEAYNAMGAAYSRQQKWKEALKAYQRALENKLYPTPHVAYMNTGRVYIAQKEYDKAVEAFYEAKRHSNQDFIIYELGAALFQSGKVKEAIKEFREGIAISPQNANLRYSLAVALLKDGNKQAALAEFQKTVELAPGTDIAVQASDYIKTLR
jgi:pentatricopeptide repeat protein